MTVCNMTFLISRQINRFMLNVVTCQHETYQKNKIESQNIKK